VVNISETTNTSAATRQRTGRQPASLPPASAALAYRVNDAAAISGLGRSSLYKLMNSGQLRSVLVAGRRLIPADALRELMKGAA
jgi:Helix-turn-helix domain